MRDKDASRGALPELRVYGKKDGASFQVIVLGSSGGPREDNVTGMLVRAPQTEWRKGSMIAVDAGAHLASIIHILEREMPTASETLPAKGYSRVLDKGPFAGVRFPNISAKANALYIFRELLHAFLITHPHLDHLAGMAINTPALEYGREAKTIVALPSTIEAIKNHIFNDWLWPNLSDESNGVGFVTYRRLMEGGNPRLGLGESRGYVSVCDGLATKCWSASHGKCQRRRQSTSHQHSDSFGWPHPDYNVASRRLSRISDDHSYFAALAQQSQSSNMYDGRAPQMNVSSAPMTPGLSGMPPGSAVHADGGHMFEPVSSSAFFVRNDATGQELLIFGDVEPDSVSMSPRNHIIWDDAAGKIATDSLKAIFIECSYDDSVRNEDLYGHLCPRHLIAELVFLANCVISKRKQLAAGLVLASATDATDSGTAAEAPPDETATMGTHMTMRQPPTPSELKRKRKRALNGDLPTSPELGPVPSERSLSSPPLPSSYVGTRSISSSRKRQSQELREPRDSPAPNTPLRGRAVQFQHSAGNAPNAVPSGSQPLPGPGAPALTALNTTTAVPPNTHAHSHAHLAPHSREKLPNPLTGLTVHIIHVKDTLLDGPCPGDIIVAQLQALSEEGGLGCEFHVTNCGDSIWV